MSTHKLRKYPYITPRKDAPLAIRLINLYFNHSIDSFELGEIHDTLTSARAEAREWLSMGGGVVFLRTLCTSEPSPRHPGHTFPMVDPRHEEEQLLY
jgi:hypothetical protein